MHIIAHENSIHDARKAIIIGATATTFSEIFVYFNFIYTFFLNVHIGTLTCNSGTVFGRSCCAQLINEALHPFVNSALIMTVILDVSELKVMAVTRPGFTITGDTITDHVH